MSDQTICFSGTSEKRFRRWSILRHDIVVRHTQASRCPVPKPFVGRRPAWEIVIVLDIGCSPEVVRVAQQITPSSKSFAFLDMFRQLRVWVRILQRLGLELLRLLHYIHAVLYQINGLGDMIVERASATGVLVNVEQVGHQRIRETGNGEEEPHDRSESHAVARKRKEGDTKLMSREIYISYL